MHLYCIYSNVNKLYNKGAYAMAKKSLTHTHHIVPKHAGGTDDPDNLIELTVEEHAEAHRILYEQYNRWQDYVAWQSLSGRIAKEEMIRFVQSNIDKSYCSSESFKEKLREGWIKRKNKGLGVPWNKGKTKENSNSINKTANKLKKHHEEKTIPCIGDSMRGKDFSEEHKKKLSNIAKNRSKIECEHCGKKVTKQMYARWHGDNCKSL